MVDLIPKMVIKFFYEVTYEAPTNEIAIVKREIEDKVRKGMDVGWCLLKKCFPTM